MTEIHNCERVNKLLPAFIDSTKTTFETMVFLPVVAQNAVPKNRGTPMGYISGTISLTGDDQCGNLSVMFPMDLAKSIFRSMMGMQASDPVQDEELHDVVGEIANMVAGGAKSRLQAEGVNFKIGLPTVVVGENHYIDPPKDAQTVVVPIESEKGSFYVELSF